MAANLLDHVNGAIENQPVFATLGVDTATMRTTGPDVPDLPVRVIYLVVQAFRFMTNLIFGVAHGY